MRSILALTLVLLLSGCSTNRLNQPSLTICQFSDLTSCAKLVISPTGKMQDILETNRRNVEIWYSCAKKFDKLANEARICLDVPLK